MDDAKSITTANIKILFITIMFKNL
jgi:hypothetical protein